MSIFYFVDKFLISKVGYLGFLPCPVVESGACYLNCLKNCTCKAVWSHVRLRSLCPYFLNLSWQYRMWTSLLL
ncbi:hypothetical protein I79_008660 [Cricetulus griseus]|uniref:Uncharacterized protein n=1 Tax=Cricetulus griseus TaxID=10029 RepID=G3HDR7_CRIGR|nr:hypothetical protein I79_008660 [Cricetulus griseus]